MFPRSRLTSKMVIKTLMIGAAAASLAACATKKPPEPAPTPYTPAPEAPPPPAYQPPAAQAPTGPVPGSIQDFIINAGDRVYFDTDMHTLSAEARSILSRQAQWLQRYPAVQVRIEGNADERGTREYNLALGARRAEAVRAFLASQGLSASRITTISYGKERPIDGGSGEDAWAKNRNAHTAITSGAR